MFELVVCKLHTFLHTTSNYARMTAAFLSQIYKIKEEDLDNSKMRDDGKFKLNKSGKTICCYWCRRWNNTTVKNCFLKVLEVIKGITNL